MLEQPLGSAAYSLLNTLGSVAALLFAVITILLEWRRRREPPKSLLRNYNIFRYLKKDMRRKFNPVFYLLCYAAAYLVLMRGIYLTGILFNFAKVGSRTLLLGRGVNYASGVLLFFAVFLPLAKLFPGNGKPTRQLEFVMPALALAHVFNRVACFLGGCCYGVPCPFGVVYPDSAAASTVYGPGTRIFPNQLLESFVMLLCFVLLLVLRARGKRTLPIFPLVFGATGFLLGFGMDHSYELLKPMFGFTYPTPFTHLLVFFVGVFFLVLVEREKRRAKPSAAEPEQST
ncbi:MAG: prolipoprotein diacylglyceryl transferase [Oscillospiraceae bacterium]|jgi:prolipoprotein diacylglyceryltransferase|nr:prolipoprotein diacylglyceryl transferase [Oscillospiraceae bacterium]